MKHDFFLKLSDKQILLGSLESSTDENLNELFNEFLKNETKNIISTLIKEISSLNIDKHEKYFYESQFKWQQRKTCPVKAANILLKHILKTILLNGGNLYTNTEANGNKVYLTYQL